MPCGWELGKVTVGLASHWPCVTDNSGITTYGLMALEREMSTPPIPSRSVAQFTFTMHLQVMSSCYLVPCFPPLLGLMNTSRGIASGVVIIYKHTNMIATGSAQASVQHETYRSVPVKFKFKNFTLLIFLNTKISIAPYGRNFRGAGHVWTTCPGSLLGNAAAGSRTRDLLIASPAP